MFLLPLGPKFFNIRPSSLQNEEEEGEDIIDPSIDEEVCKNTGFSFDLSLSLSRHVR